MKIGYMRISKGEQTTALQEDALASAQCEKTFRDVMSGAKERQRGSSCHSSPSEIKDVPHVLGVEY